MFAYSCTDSEFHLMSLVLKPLHLKTTTPHVFYDTVRREDIDGYFVNFINERTCGKYYKPTACNVCAFGRTLDHLLCFKIHLIEL